MVKTDTDIDKKSLANWLVSRIHDVGCFLENPLEEAVSAGFDRVTALKFLEGLEKSGKVLLIYEDAKNSNGTMKRMLKSVLLKSKEITDKKDNEKRLNEAVEPPSSKNKAKIVLLVDVDNMILRARQMQDKNIGVEDILPVLIRHTETLGEATWKQFFITTATLKGISAIDFLYESDVPVNIVPPRPNAADEEIERVVDFILMSCPDISCFVLAGNDGKAFRPLCKKIRENNKVVHIITPGAAAGGLSRAADKTISFFKLLADYRRDDRPKDDSRNLRIKKTNPFMFEAMSLNDKMLKMNNLDKIESVDIKEQFLIECLKIIEAYTVKEGSWLSFIKMNELIWLNLRESLWDWEKRGFGFDDCLKATEALATVSLLKYEEREFEGRKTKAYFVRKITEGQFVT